MDSQKLIDTAQALVVKSKGILAADESGGTIKRRFDSINVESTEDNRRDYREMLFRTEGVSDYISGVILFDETIKQNGADGTPIVKVLLDRGIIPGIKVDKGTQALPGSPSELVTEGLDGLRARLEEYASLGAGFTKWRGVITIGEGIPTPYCIEANAHALARFAALSQEAGLVPIVEPEVLMDGDHSIDQCFEANEATLKEVFANLSRQGVMLEGALLKPSMVLSGNKAANRANPEEVAAKTIECFRRSVPAALPGIVFLSGGQSDEEATANLNAINERANEFGAPWALSFSYGRGLQAAPLKAWSGQSSNVEQAKEAFYNRAKLTSAARDGVYVP
ncbi:MAG: fructose-bisphosphate aldolase class I [SAR202 cluster bacterium]|nr:fructose-bisphosphate aldolase class I [SAR202 cluster bacterium]|tara:strand:- start:3156 stop:4166 length:1011 start_codon:yes stop_codon:yes gene_type:complete